jgi:hypothetical protein
LVARRVKLSAARHDARGVDDDFGGPGETAFDAANAPTSWLPGTTFAGTTTARLMVIAVMATAAIPKAARGIEGS